MVEKIRKLQKDNDGYTAQVIAKASKTMMPDQTIGSGALSTEYAGGGPQTVTLFDDDGREAGQVRRITKRMLGWIPRRTARRR